MTGYLEHASVTVRDLAEAVAFIRAARPGFQARGRGAEPRRKRIYFFDRGGIEYEFVEHLSPAPAERNDYALG